MGWMYADGIERAAMLLLRVLQGWGQVSYSTFYDGTEETNKKLENDLLLDEGTAELAMDLAATHLERQGLVRIEELRTKMSDGHLDYKIALTSKGQSWFKKKFPLHFVDVEL